MVMKHAPGVEICNILKEMGHMQPPTPSQTDNSTADGIVNLRVQPKRTKAHTSNPTHRYQILLPCQMDWMRPYDARAHQHFHQHVRSHDKRITNYLIPSAHRLPLSAMSHQYTRQIMNLPLTPILITRLTSPILFLLPSLPPLPWLLHVYMLLSCQTISTAMAAYLGAWIVQSTCSSLITSSLFTHFLCGLWGGGDIG